MIIREFSHLISTRLNYKLDFSKEEKALILFLRKLVNFHYIIKELMINNFDLIYFSKNLSLNNKLSIKVPNNIDKEFYLTLKEEILDINV